MKTLNLILVVALWCICSDLYGEVVEENHFPHVGALSPQQSRQITGVVLDDLGEPVIGANVIEKGTTNGTMTDLDGNFSLNVPADAILQISYIGYIQQEVSVSNQTVFSIVLREDTQTLDEVVVVGFGTQKKVNLTGSVGTVDAKALDARPVQNAAQMLQGLVPGLNISQNTGNLDKKSSISIRGTGTIDDGSSNSPLILIDGMEGDINAINPQDIENVSVLKDASAASIYGSRAPFGVILITTKKGTPGKTTINYNNSFRWNKPMVLPKSMDALTFASYFNDALINDKAGVHFNEAWMQGISDYMSGKITTNTVPNGSSGQWEEGFDARDPTGTGGWDNRDYYREIFRSSAASQEHNISISGGNEKVTYYTSFNLLDQGGLMRFNQDQYDRYSATAKVGYEVYKWMHVNYSNRFVREKYQQPLALTNDLFADLGRQSWPTLPMYDNNGNLFQRTALALRDEGIKATETDNSYQQLQFVFEPITNWKTFAELNYNVKNYNLHENKQKTYRYDMDNNPYEYNRNTHVKEENHKEDRMGFNLYSEYFHSIQNKHNLKGMIGLQFDRMKQRKFNASREGLIVPGINVIDGTNGLNSGGEEVAPSVGGELNRWATMGYFGRVNYDYLGRYLLEVNLRYDGSSRFRSGKRWVLSPSFSVGWNIAQEDFWESLTGVVNTLKLRASYGQLANQNTNNWYPTYELLTIKGKYSDWFIDGSRQNTTWAPFTLVDENLTWEKVRTFNVGLDYGLFNNRLTGSFDYFIRNTVDMLGPAQEMPALIGVGVPKTNNTDLRDAGYEIQIEWRDRLRFGLGYGVKVSLADYQTTITRYPNTTGDLATYIEGRKYGEIWGFETLGIAKTQEEMDAHLALHDQSSIGSEWGAGDIMYANLDGDPAINTGSFTIDDHGDLKVIGNSTPRYHLGFELTADYKGFDIRAFFQGVMKRDYWAGRQFFWGAYSGGSTMTNWSAGSSGMWWSAGFVEHEDYFRDSNTWSVQNGYNGENLNSYYPRPSFSNDGKNAKRQTAYLQNAAYMRLKNLQIGYTLPRHITQKAGISRLRLYVSGENLFTITSLKSMYDPETLDGSWSDAGNVYPLSRVFSFGLNVNF